MRGNDSEGLEETLAADQFLDAAVPRTVLTKRRGMIALVPLVYFAVWSGLAGAFDLHFFAQQFSHRHAQDARGLADKLH